MIDIWPVNDPHEAERRRTALTARICETPCPKCGGKLDFGEHSVGLLGITDEIGLWEFCNRHTFPYCETGCRKLMFADVVPRPVPVGTV